MRYLYSFLLYLITPWLILRLWLRSRRQSAYRERWPERFGRYAFRFPACIWLHCVSVGETAAATPLIKALAHRYPNWPLLVTTTTPTGAARVKALCLDNVHHAYLPYDYPYAVSRFLQAARPVAGWIFETELWPNLFAACNQHHIPLGLLNARLSEKSAKNYRLTAGLIQRMLTSLHLIAAQTPQDAKRLIQLGAPSERVQVTGNIKFDSVLPQGVEEEALRWRTQLGNRWIWVAASTHPEENDIILEAHYLLRRHRPDALLILAPRHPERFHAPAQFSKYAFTLRRRSQKEDILPETAVYLADTFGELALMYGLAHVAFVGGSLFPHGGHNLLEPAALCRPTLSGPHCFNFEQVQRLLQEAGALITVRSAQELAEQLIILMEDPLKCVKMGEAGQAVVASNRGALSKQLVLVYQTIDSRLDTHAQLTS